MEEMNGVERLQQWIWKRYQILKLKKQGQVKPWTNDPIFQQYSFCNVHREDDKTTKFIRQWAKRADDDPNLWFAFCVARLINRAESLNEMGWAVFRGARVLWNADKFIEICADIKNTGGKIFSGAYIVSTNGHKMDKIAYLEKHVLSPLWEKRNAVKSVKTCEQLYAELRAFNGMGTFMAAQVVADAKFHGALLRATDWWTFAAPGPGSRRGLNRVYGQPKDTPWSEHEWLYALHKLQDVITPWCKSYGIPSISAQDLQNCLCEFDKYERTRLGEGRPRSRYNGVTND